MNLKRAYNKTQNQTILSQQGYSETKKKNQNDKISYTKQIPEQTQYMSLKRNYSQKQNCPQNQVVTNQSTQQDHSTLKSQKVKKYAYIKSKNTLLDSNRQPIQPQTQNIYNLQHYRNQQAKYNFSGAKLMYEMDNDSGIDKGQNTQFGSKDEEVIYLKSQLQRQRQKFQTFQQQTIQNQIKILQTINVLQLKLREVKSQNLTLFQQNQALKRLQQNQALKRQKSENPSFSEHQFFNSPYQKNLASTQALHFSRQIQVLRQQIQRNQKQYKNLEKQYKKVKGIGSGLIDMMRKVDKIEVRQDQNELKLAWKWIKKIVWEYQAIRNKAFEWKKAYDQLNHSSSYSDSVSSDNELN